MSHLQIVPLLLLGVLLFCCSDNPIETISAPPVPANLDDGWEVSSLSSVGMNPERLTWLSAAIKNGDFGHIHSVLVVRDGKLVFEEYYESYSINKRHALASVTKSIVSILIGIAVDQGYIKDIDAPVADYFPQYAYIFSADSNKYKITIRHLLSMSSGLEWDEWSYPYDNIKNSHYQMERSDDWYKFVLERPLTREPGTYFTYNSGGSILLGAILKKACGMHADQWANEMLFTPLGITSYQWEKIPNGQPQTGGGLHLRPRDLAKIGFVVLNNGMWNDIPIVSDAWLELSTAKTVNIWPGVNYGFQWWLRDLPEPYGSASVDNDVVYGLGYAGQYLFVIPEMNMVVVVHSWNLNEYEPAPIYFLQDFILSAVVPSKNMAGG